MAVAEVTVLCDHNPVLLISERGKRRIGRSVPVWQLRRVHNFVAGRNQKLERASSATACRTGTSRSAERHHSTLTGNQGPELERSQEIVALKVRIILDDLIDGHTRSQEFQQALDRVARALVPSADRDRSKGQQ